MEVMVTVPVELESSLVERAVRNGQDIGDYLNRLVTGHLKKASLEELLAPVREDFARSGMTEDELNELIEQERQALWEEKHGKK